MIEKIKIELGKKEGLNPRRSRMERVVSAMNRAANSTAVVNTFLGAVFCALAARSWAQDQTVRALEAENEVLLKRNKQIKSTIWEWKQTLYAEASADPQKALVPLSNLQAIYGDVVTPVSNSGGDGQEAKPPKAEFMV